MKHVCIALLVGAVLASQASAVIVGSDMDDPNFTPAGGGNGLGFGEVIQTAEADTGWYANKNISRMFNRTNWDLNYVWANKPTSPDNTGASTLNLTMDGKASTGSQQLVLDVFVLGGDPNSDVANAAEVEVSLWGYNGDSTTVDGNLAAVTSTDDPSGGSPDITWLDSQPLVAVTALDTWETQIFPIEMGSGYDYILVALSAAGGDAWGVGIDNVDIVPEPATLSVLALGGLALLRRRR